MKASEPPAFFEVFPLSLNRHGEELCGDQAKVLRTPTRTIVALSDGLGSGVKANILSRLTTEIIVTMIREDAALQDVVETVVGTLPMCRVRRIAYATFVIIDIAHATGEFKVVNFDSPAPVFLRGGKLTPLTRVPQNLEGRTLELSEGQLGHGDVLAAFSDGVLYAGMGTTLNFGWGWDEVGAHLEEALSRRAASAETLVRSVMGRTEALYRGRPGDDAMMVGILARQASRLLVFTGPPVSSDRDVSCVERLLGFDGRKVVCGGTTGNIVANHLGTTIATDMESVREEVPPLGSLPGVDLVTEGILTLTRTIQLLDECSGNARNLPADRNAAVLLAQELLRADSIEFLVGETVNPYYQNPLLPRSVSIRRYLLTQLTESLARCHKQVTVEWC